MLRQKRMKSEIRSEDKIAALYIRVSTDAQREEGYSIDAQKQMLIGYCISKGIKHYESYIDGGFSGSNIERPRLTSLINDIEDGRVSHVIVYKLDRLSRSQKDTLYLIEDVLIPHDVCFVSLNENMDTSTPIGRAMLGIMSAFAQLERETIRERTRMGMKERIKCGLWRGGGKIPFGYDYDSERGVLVPNEDAEKVRLMYKLYLDGWSMMSIAKYVGLKYERMAEQILKRRTNCGYIVYNGEEYKGKHEPIVSEETFNKAQKMMGERSRASYGSKSLLSGMIYCGVCGSKMRYQKWGKSGYKIYCYSQDKGKPHLSSGNKCNNVKVWADDLEQAVLSDLFKLSEQNIDDEKSTREDSLSGLLSKQSERLKRKLKNLYNLYSDTADETLIITINELKEELRLIQEKINDAERDASKNKERAEAINKLNTVADAWEYMTLKQKQNVLRGVIDKIVITYDKTDVYYKLPD